MTMVTTEQLEKAVTAQEPTPEEAAAVAVDGVGGDEDPGALDRLEQAAADPREVKVPDWAPLPTGFKIQPGKRVSFFRFRAKWTDKPEKGDRWCMVWNLTEAEESASYKRCRGEQSRTFPELAKSTIRVVDGHVADRTGTGGPASVALFWNDIGTACRQLIQNYYLKTHTLNQEEQADFFANCLVVTTAVGS